MHSLDYPDDVYASELSGFIEIYRVTTREQFYPTSRGQLPSVLCAHETIVILTDTPWQRRPYSGSTVMKTVRVVVPSASSGLTAKSAC
jgi:hypothetical protein